MRRKMLDLFCCEGVGAWGYWLSGRFSEIVGVDVAEMSTRYSFDFVRADALSLTYEFLDQFDFIHASPPCQAYSKLTPVGASHPRLVAATHLMLQAAGKPYVIENVEGSSRELRPNLVIEGHYVGLPITRRRYFYVSTLTAIKPLILRTGIDAHLRSSHVTHIHGGEFVCREELVRVMGLAVINPNRQKHITRYGIEQGIPPAMTRLIAEMVFEDKLLVS